MVLLRATASRVELRVNLKGDDGFMNGTDGVIKMLMATENRGTVHNVAVYDTAWILFGNLDVGRQRRQKTKPSTHRTPTTAESIPTRPRSLPRPSSSAARPAA